MAVSSRDSESHSGAADHSQLEDSSSLSFKRQHRRPRSPPVGTQYIHSSCLNNEHVNELLRNEATVAKRRRTPKLIKKPDARTDISDVKKRLYIWKHSDASYKGLGRSTRIERAVKGAYDIHITEEYISQALEGIDEGKMGPLGEWRIEIYQPLPELDLYALIIRDVWTGGWVSYQKTVDKISPLQPNYLIIKGVPEALSPGFNETMRGWEERMNIYNAAGWDIRIGILLVAWVKHWKLENSADRTENGWDHLSLKVLLWKKKFTLDDTGKWIFTEEFVDPNDALESPSP
ncbi:hypothetical protein M422DRAFT_260672 [Sphaerobolus stellatus SS14]|uniref:Uncharacterized protein n=1 Tax=Sphaerobolus stellatus (strain SS14) TaxID=990650 RepID=A0A0C9VHK8_SPHS4|nr:hypothetical protein M422DRAFT_260672 [Sphaerobolus stellatus SS14]